MGSGKFKGGVNPVMDLSYSLHATETGINSGLIGHLAHMPTFYKSEESSFHLRVEK